MRTKLYILLIAIGLAVLQTSQAAVLYDDQVTVTGSIFRGSAADPSQTFPKASFTIANVLQLLGITNVDPSTLSFFNSDGGIVLAPSSSTAGADVTPVVVVFKRQKDPTVVQTDDASGLAFDKERVLDGKLPGTRYETVVYNGGVITSTGKVVAGGTVNGDPVIIKATILDSYSAQ